MTDTFYAVRVLMTGRQKPHNVVVRAESEDLAKRGAHLAYPGLINRVTMVNQVHRSDVIEGLDQFGDVRDEDGAILVLPTDPRFPARAEHLFVFRIKFKASAGLGYPAEQEWDTHAVIEADSEDCAWAIYGNVFNEFVERVDLDFVRDPGSLALFVTLDRACDLKEAEWIRNYVEMPSVVFHSRNFRTFVAFALTQMKWDRAADFWMKHFDDRRGPPASARTFTGDEVATLIDDILRRNVGGDAASLGVALKARLAA